MTTEPFITLGLVADRQRHLERQADHARLVRRLRRRAKHTDLPSPRLVTPPRSPAEAVAVPHHRRAA